MRRFGLRATPLRSRTSVVATYIGAALFAVWILFPIWFTVSSSFSNPTEMVARPPHWIPLDPTILNYQAVLTNVTAQQAGAATSTFVPPDLQGQVIKALAMSFLIGVSVMVLNLVIGGAAGYAYSRFRFRGSRAGYLFLLVSQVVPAIAIVTPFFVFFRVVGLIGSPLALVGSYLVFTLPLSIWLLKGYFDGVSPEIEEAALVDGASRLRIIWAIAMPIARPGAIATGLLVFLQCWSEFFYANVLTNQLTIPPLLAGYNTPPLVFGWNVLAAATMLSILPPLVLALAFQRFVVSGLSHGALK